MVSNKAYSQFKKKKKKDGNYYKKIKFNEKNFRENVSMIIDVIPYLLHFYGLEK